MSRMALSWRQVLTRFSFRCFQTGTFSVLGARSCFMRLGSIIFFFCLVAEVAKGQLSLHIDASATILPGQLLTVHLTLSNENASDVQKVHTLAVARFYIGFENGSLKEYTRASHFSMMGLETGTVALAPNGKISGWTTILY